MDRPSLSLPSLSPQFPGDNHVASGGRRLSFVAAVVEEVRARMECEPYTQRTH